MCRADFSLTKYFSFVAKQAELRRSRSMSFILPRSQQRLVSQMSLIVEEEGLVPDFQSHVGHSLLSYHFNGSLDLEEEEDETAEEETLDELTFIHDFDEMFQFVKKEEERNDEMDDVYDNVIIAHDFDTVFAGL
mmetsp:Transcript_18943/g.20549  ORF Transcript_18943/g.20549 Transcript_18943/m.20549 type:complete len:134 (+) Transcript_18943:124-525(+)|eukprot:gene2571-2733_t